MKKLVPRPLQTVVRLACAFISNKAIMFKWRFLTILRPKDMLLRNTDRRYNGLWMSDAPELLTKADLQEGYILFAGRMQKTLITHATSSTLSHCGVLIQHEGVLQVFEATPPKVKLSTIDEFVERYSYVSVFVGPILSNQDLDRARTFALSHLNMPYAKVKAALLPVYEYIHQVRHWYRKKPDLRNIPNRRREKRSYFCSEIVLDYFREAGVQMLNKRYYRATAWTPGLLAEENIFRHRGYIASSYTAIHPDDPVLSGNGLLLPEWERARIAGDVGVLKSFTYSMKSAIAAQIALEKQALSEKKRHKQGRSARRERPWKG